MKAFAALGPLLLDLSDGVRRLGRAGGALLVGAALLAGTGGGLLLLRAAAGEAERLPRAGDVRLAAWLLLGLALLLALGGLRQLVRPRPPRGAAHPPLETAELVALARSALRPFFVCLSCRRLWGRSECVGRCPQCDSAADCLEVRDDEDLAMVEAALR